MMEKVITLKLAEFAYGFYAFVDSAMMPLAVNSVNSQRTGMHHRVGRKPTIALDYPALTSTSRTSVPRVLISDL